MENYLRYWTPVDFFCPRSEDGMCKFHRFLGEQLSAGFQAKNSRLRFLSTYELWEVTAVIKRGLALNLTKLFILPW